MTEFLIFMAVVIVVLGGAYMVCDYLLSKLY